MSAAWESLRKHARGGAFAAVTAAVALAVGLPPTTASATPAVEVGGHHGGRRRA